MSVRVGDAGVTGAAPMSVLVTGGSGKLGGVVVADLMAHGHNVLNADLVPPAEQLCPFLQVDLQDAGQVVEALAGVDLCQSSDAIVHLAATPAPGRTPNATTFKNNVTGTYNVFEAARRLGVRNVVYASSEIIFGLPFSYAAHLLARRRAVPAQAGERLRPLQAARRGDGRAVLPP